MLKKFYFQHKVLDLNFASSSYRCMHSHGDRGNEIDDDKKDMINVKRDFFKSFSG